MAQRNTSKTAEPRVGKRLVILAILIVILLISLGAASLTSGKSRWTPDFALDLEGGTQIILKPVTTDGSKVSESDIEQAIEIIRQRVDASGVSEAEISSQGTNNILVSLPGNPSQETLDLVRTSAVLRMRPVLQVDSPMPLTPDTVTSGEGEATGEEGAEGVTNQSFEITDQDGNVVNLGDNATVEGAQSTATYSPEELEKAAREKADADGDGKLSDKPATEPSDPSDAAWITEQALYEAYTLDCTQSDARIAASQDDPAKPLVACSSTSGGKYILGPAEIEGVDITQAVSGYDSQKGQNVVSIQFDSTGTKAFTEVTTRLVNLESPRNQFAVVLDGSVISAAVPETIISGGSAQISGSFTPEEATTLANQLSFGSLPLHFDVESEEQISATLGSESLRAGLIAGLIGIVLIILYLLWQYHGLGVIAIGSITLAVGLSYLIVCLLSYLIGMRLSLAGVVALIISIGITADSFIVFFERIRDEQRDGRSNISAVAHGWQRAKRTVIVADSVNLLAAVVLYFLAVGSVRGFAFTLGLTTILDLIIIFMFTYPAMTLLVRKTAFFGQGKAWSGMDSVALGNEAHYKGAGRFKHSSKDKEKDTVDGVVDEAEELVEAKAGAKMSLAERRAAQRRKEREEAKKANEAELSEDVSAVDETVTSGEEEV